jgi:hypothetical protein
MRLECRSNAIERLGVESGIANDAALPDIFAADFELRFYENHKLAGRPEKRDESRKNEGDRDEADVADDETDRLADIGGLQIARVSALVKNHAGVGSEFPIDLAGSGIDAMHAQSAVLEQAIGEASGGSADIEADFLLWIDGELAERGFELEPATADVAKGLLHFESGIQID